MVADESPGARTSRDVVFVAVRPLALLWAASLVGIVAVAAFVVVVALFRYRDLVAYRPGALAPASTGLLVAGCGLDLGADAVLRDRDAGHP